MGEPARLVRWRRHGVLLGQAQMGANAFVDARQGRITKSRLRFPNGDFTAVQDRQAVAISARSRVARILPLGAEMPSSNASVSRRRFCAGACQAVSGATLATVFAGCGGGGDSPTSPSSRGVELGVAAGRFTGSGVDVTVAGSALGAVGGSVLVESVAGVFLLSRTAESAFTAIDAVCSHQSCTITNADGSAYVCPCHGSRYDRNGRVLAGPATAALRQFQTTFTSGVVTIAL